MKRIIALSLALIVLCMSFAACSTREKTDLTGVKSISELNATGAKIAAQTNTFHLDALKAQGTGLKVSDYDSFSTLLTALNSGAIDGYVAEEPTAWSVCAKDSTLSYIALENNKTGFTATAADVGVAVAFKTDSELIAKVNAVLATITEEQKTNLMKQMVTLTENVDEQLKEVVGLEIPETTGENGVLKIAMECDYQPYNWTQTKDINNSVKIANTQGYANGYDVQIARFVAASLGMTLEVYAYEWDSLIPAVQAGTVDGIIAGMSPTEEREKEVDFTECYWSSNLVIIIKK